MPTDIGPKGNFGNPMLLTFLLGCIPPGFYALSFKGKPNVLPSDMANMEDRSFNVSINKQKAIEGLMQRQLFNSRNGL